MASSAGVPAAAPGAAAAIGAGGGEGGADLKRRRLLDAGGPIEDDEIARQKMRDAEVYARWVHGTDGEYAGFDPNNVEDVKSVNADDTSYQHKIKPMGYFAEKGDLPMMRWLYVNGADTRDEMVTFTWFPMYAAARAGHLGVCKWLFQHGAAGDVKRRDWRDRTKVVPLSAIFHQSDKRELSRWLILRGVLCKDDDTGDLDIDLIKSSLEISTRSTRSDHHGQIFVLSHPDHGLEGELPELLKWAKEHHQTRSSFDMVLMGTLPPPTYSATKLRDELVAKIGIPSAVDRILAIAPPDQCRLLWDDLFAHRVSNLAVFSGKSGMLQLIGAYVGIMRGREARIVRQLAERLPGIIAELGRN